MGSTLSKSTYPPEPLRHERGPVCRASVWNRARKGFFAMIALRTLPIPFPGPPLPPPHEIVIVVRVEASAPAAPPPPPEPEPDEDEPSWEDAAWY